MMRGIRHGWLVSTLVACSFGSFALAEDRSDAADRERATADVEQLKQEVRELRQQVALAASQDMDKARTDSLRAQIREVLNDREFRESLMPAVMSAGYDDGFYIKSSDDKWKITFNGLLQFRYTYYNTQSRNTYIPYKLPRDDRSGFDVQRARLALNGQIGSSDWTWHLEFKSDAPQQYDIVMDSAWINYRFADELQIRMGEFGLASTHTEMVGGGNQQFVDKSVVNAMFGLGASVGVRLWGQLFNKRLEYYLDFVNGLSDDGNTNVGRTITADPAENDGNPALVFRTIWHILGDPALPSAFNEGDIEHHTSPVWDFGFHYAFDDNYHDRFGTRIPVSRIRPFGILGGYALTDTQGLQINQFGFDTQFKFCGFSLAGEYIVRTVDVRRGSFDNGPLAAYYIAGGDNSTTAQHGAYVQAGYFLPIPGMENKIEAVARVGGVSTLGYDQQGTWEYGAGVNYYISGNRVKLQADVSKIYEAPTTSSYSSLANVNDDALVFRVQMQVAF